MLLIDILSTSFNKYISISLDVAAKKKSTIQSLKITKYVSDISIEILIEFYCDKKERIIRFNGKLSRCERRP